MKVLWIFIALLSTAQIASAQTNSFLFTTLNCYWFFGKDEKSDQDVPKTDAEHDQKAGHLVGLLPSEAPLLVGLQEIGTEKDVAKLVHSANSRYKRKYQPLFVQGKDSATGQDVAAIMDTNRGWGVHGKPSRVSDLEKHLSKHLVVRLTNAISTIDVCVVHLRVPRNEEGKSKQVEQNRALLQWAMRHLGKDPKANVMILGDFNESGKPGTEEQSLSVLFKAKPPLLDTMAYASTPDMRTHAGGKSLDRIFISDAIMKGHSGLRFDSFSIQKHSRGKGQERRLYTDHFPVTVRLVPAASAAGVNAVEAKVK